MNQNKAVFVCMIGVILFAIGIVLVSNSISIGNALTNSFITKAGHSFESAQLNTILSGYITNTQICGAVVSGVGGITAVLFGYLYWKKN